MIIGIPKESKDGERRVGLIPQAVKTLIQECGVEVWFEEDAGLGSGYQNTEYQNAGGKIIHAHQFHIGLVDADLIVKVKEPQLGEFDPFFKRKKTTKAVAAFLHFPGNPWLKPFLDAYKVQYFAYEEYVDEKTSERPILAAMSEIAGRRALLEGFHYLSSTFSVRGIMPEDVRVTIVGTLLALLALLKGFHYLSSTFSVRGIMPEDARVTIVGAGVAGKAAVHLAYWMGAKQLVIMDKRDIGSDLSLAQYGRCISSTAENIQQILPETDLLISAVAQAGKPAPKIFTKEMIASMPHGSVFTDISIDEGGSSGTSRPTSHSAPIYVESGVVHYCVPNIPGAVPRTASDALSSAVLPPLKRFIASLG